MRALPPRHADACSCLADGLVQDEDGRVAKNCLAFVRMVEEASRQPSKVSCHCRDCALRLACLTSLHCQVLYEQVAPTLHEYLAPTCTSGLPGPFQVYLHAALRARHVLKPANVPPTCMHAQLVCLHACMHTRGVLRHATHAQCLEMLLVVAQSPRVPLPLRQTAAAGVLDGFFAHAAAMPDEAWSQIVELLDFLLLRCSPACQGCCQPPHQSLSLGCARVRIGQGRSIAPLPADYNHWSKCNTRGCV